MDAVLRGLCKKGQGNGRWPWWRQQYRQRSLDNSLSFPLIVADSMLDTETARPAVDHGIRASNPSCLGIWFISNLNVIDTCCHDLLLEMYEE